MLRSDQYVNSNSLFTRYEIEGEPLEITVEEKTTRYRNKDWPTRYIHWKGLHRIERRGETFLADRSMVADSGPKLGVSVLYTRHPEVPYTKEERLAGRERINRVVQDLFGCRVIWDTEIE